MSVEKVRYELRDTTAILTINRPEVRNALDLEAMDALHACATRALDEKVRAVILTGEGTESFCAGGDLKSFSKLRSTEDGQMMSLKMQRALHVLSSLPVPVICVLNGYAMGGGSETLLATDIRIAEEHVTISWRQLFFGVGLGWGAAARLRREIGARHAFRMVLMQETLSAEHARELGIIDEIVERGTGLQRALELAKRIAEMAPVGVRCLKRQLSSSTEMQQEAALFAESWGSADHHEAVAAFFEKRPPKFEGR